MSEFNRDFIRDTVAAENLGRFNWLQDRSPGTEEAGIVPQGAGWRVYLTDEQGYPRYDKFHEDEAGALADFLKRARAINKLIALRDKRLRNQSNPADAQ